MDNRRDGVVVRASAWQSVDVGFIPLVESYQKTLKYGIYSFPAWRSAFMGDCGEQAGKFACCVFEQGKTGGPGTSKIATLKRMQDVPSKTAIQVAFS